MGKNVDGLKTVRVSLLFFHSDPKYDEENCFRLLSNRRNDVIP
jgi:hypothetical protein